VPAVVAFQENKRPTRGSVTKTVFINRTQTCIDVNGSGFSERVSESHSAAQLFVPKTTGTRRPTIGA
jgi:hypothetical protein